ALHDRVKFSRNPHTHASANGPGAIILIVTAFDVWMSEIILGMLLPQEDARAHLDDQILSKYRFLYTHFRRTDAPSSDLSTVILPRYELVHHLQRPDPTLIPSWFPQLQQQGLLITHPSAPEGVDYSFTEKLGSYGLAYWVFEVIEAQVHSIFDQSNNPRTPL